MNSSSYRDIAWKRVISVTQSNLIHDWNKQLKQSKQVQSCVSECKAISGGSIALLWYILWADSTDVRWTSLDDLKVQIIQKYSKKTFAWYLKFFVLAPSQHKTLVWRPSGVHNVQKTLFWRQNNVLC